MEPVLALTLFLGVLAFSSLTLGGVLLGEEEDGSRAGVKATSWAWVGVVLVTGLCCLQSTGFSLGKNRAVLRITDFLGLSQSWKPLAFSSASLVELVAREQDGSRRAVWRVDRDSSRRMRLFLKSVARTKSWSLALPRALSVHLKEGKNYIVWMRVEQLDESFILQNIELSLLSSSPGEMRLTNYRTYRRDDI